MRIVTAKRLRDLIEGAHDNTLVVIPGQDHSFQPVYWVACVTAIESDDIYSEDNGEELEDGERRVPVIIIG